MPFVSLPRPSLALGMLKASLATCGLEAAVEYGCLHFARHVGLGPYALANASPVSLLGEWAFAGLLFPDFAPDHDAFLAGVEPCPAFGIRTPEQIREAAWHLRNQAGSFLAALAERILKTNPRLVGCTSTFQQNLASLALLKHLKSLAPDLITVIGGGNCEGPMGAAMVERFEWLDFVVSGEADELVGGFFASLLEQGPRATAGQLPYGVLSRWSERPSGPPPRASVRDMRVLPMPDFSDYFATLHELGLDPALQVSLPVENSRGCWWGQKHHCTFCGLNGQGMNYRSRPAEQAERQFHELAHRHGTDQFIVADNIIEVSYFKTLLPALAAADSRYHIFYETKANLKREQLQRLAEAGVHYIQPGLESLCDELLTMMDKGTTALQNLQTLKWSRELGIHVNWLMLVAFPGDRLEWYHEMMEMLPLIVHLQPPRSAVRVGYHRFSPYFEKCADYGIEPIPEAAYSFVYPYPAQQVAELAYYFVDRRGSQAMDAIVEVVRAPLRNWKLRFWNERPILSLDDDGRVLHVLDTRHGLLPRRSNHTGVAREILLACESIRSQDKLQRDLLAEHPELSDSEFGHVLADLEGQGLILRRGHNLLGLGVWGSLPPVPPDLPLGRVDPERWPAPLPSELVRA